MLGVYGEEGSFLLRPVGQISWFEGVGRTFGTAQYVYMYVLVFGEDEGVFDIRGGDWPAAVMQAEKMLVHPKP